MIHDHTDTRRKTRFEISADPGSKVFVAGSFNNWNPAEHPLRDNPKSGHFKAAMHLPAGTYEYKFVINGVWCSDPKCTEWAPDGYNALNSVVHV